MKTDGLINLLNRPFMGGEIFNKQRTEFQNQLLLPRKDQPKNYE